MTALLALALALATPAQGTPVELPPGEDAAAWERTLALSRPLLPDLELGPAVGSGASVRIVSTAEGWLLDIQTPTGHAEPIRVAPPGSEAERLELLLLCAEALVRPQPTPTPILPPAPAPPSWRWGATRIAAGLDLLPEQGHPASLLIEPFTLDRRHLGIAPSFAVSTESALAPGLGLRTAQVAAGAWYGAGTRLRWRLGAGTGVTLRDLRSDDAPLLRDWALESFAAADLGLPIANGWQAWGGLRVHATPPPTILVWEGQEIPLPSWQLLLVAGLRLPGPTSALD